jgi:hypothetical protein
MIVINSQKAGPFVWLTIDTNRQQVTTQWGDNPPQCLRQSLQAHKKFKLHFLNRQTSAYQHFHQLYYVINSIHQLILSLK